MAVPSRSMIAPVGGAQFVGGLPGGHELASACPASSRAAALKATCLRMFICGPFVYEASITSETSDPPLDRPRERNAVPSKRIPANAGGEAGPGQRLGDLDPVDRRGHDPAGVARTFACRVEPADVDALPVAPARHA